MDIKNSALGAIGNTPIVKLKKISEIFETEIYAKLEFMNPGGSVKDRIAYYMIEKAEREGKIKPGDIIIENSSGNTAMGLAFVCKQKGYKLKIVVRNTISKEKVKALKILGAEIIYADASLSPEHPRSYNNLAKNLAMENPNWFYIDQHNNLDNNEAHYALTAPEIWSQTNGDIDLFITGIGTGGTISGISRYFKERNLKTKFIGVDPIGSIFYDWFKFKKISKPSKYFIEGLGDEFLLPTVQFEYIDDIIKVDDYGSFKWAKKIAKLEGLFVGGSSGANLRAISIYLKKNPKPKNILTIFPDTGYKYLSSFYDAKWLKKNLNDLNSFSKIQASHLKIEIDSVKKENCR